MSFIEVKLETSTVRGALDALADRLDDMSPFMREISEILYDQTMENFAQEGRPAWQALAPATIRERSKEGYWPGKILQRSGVLKAAVHPFSTRNEAVVSVAVPYAAIQQLGGTIERAAYGTTVRLRTDARGNLVRQGKSGRAKNLAVFAKDSHRRVRESHAEVGAHAITIPPRPYLPMTESGELQPEAGTAILDALNAYLAGSWGAAS